MKKRKAKKLVFGKDWHGWAIIPKDRRGFYWFQPCEHMLNRTREWVRVKLVIVRTRKARSRK